MRALAVRRCSSSLTPLSCAHTCSRRRTYAVSKRPGAREFTLIAGASSWASILTSAATPGRKTFETARPGTGWRTEVAVTNRTELPSCVMGSRLRRRRRGPPTRRSKASLHCSSLTPSAEALGGPPPALRRTPAMVPKRRAASSTIAAAPPGVARAAAQTKAPSPSSRAVSSRASALRATRSTLAPEARSCSATARPSPLLAPPTTKEEPSRKSSRQGYAYRVSALSIGCVLALYWGFGHGYDANHSAYAHLADVYSPKCVEGFMLRSPTSALRILRSSPQK